MRVWVGCLGCYNGGDLIGEWYDVLDCPTDMADFNVNAPAAHLIEAHEELWVFDVDEAPGRFLNREMSPVEAQEIGALLDRLESEHIDTAAFTAYCGNVVYKFDEDAIEGFEEAYCGEFGSREDYAMQLADDLGLVPDEQPWPLSYIDWERAARDLFMDYYDASSPRGIYVFRAL